MWEGALPKKLLNAVNPRRAENTRCTINADSVRQNKVINTEQNEELPMFQHQPTKTTISTAISPERRAPDITGLQHCSIPRSCTVRSALLGSKDPLATGLSEGRSPLLLITGDISPLAEKGL